MMNNHKLEAARSRATTSVYIAYIQLNFHIHINVHSLFSKKTQYFKSGLRRVIILNVK